MASLTLGASQFLVHIDLCPECQATNYGTYRLAVSNARRIVHYINYGYENLAPTHVRRIRVVRRFIDRAHG